MPPGSDPGRFGVCLVPICHQPARLRPFPEPSTVMTTDTLDRGRITARVPQRVQDTLALAASLTGATVNQFLVQSALREAERVIAEDRVIRLGARDSAAFIAAIDQPQAPNAKLAAALADHRKRQHDPSGTFDWTPRPKPLRVRGRRA